MLLFFSRRIGLTDDGEEIPIAAGGAPDRPRRPHRPRRDDDADAGRATAAPATTTPCCAGAATSCGTRTSARSSCRGSRPAASTIATASPASTRTSGSCSALSLNGFLAKSETPGVDGGQMAGKGSVVWNDNLLHTQYSLLERRRQLPRRHRLHQAARHPQALRRLRHPLPARVVAQARHPRAAPAHARTTSTPTSRTRR